MVKKGDEFTLDDEETYYIEQDFEGGENPLGKLWFTINKAVGYGALEVIPIIKPKWWDDWVKRMQGN